MSDDWNEEAQAAARAELEAEMEEMLREAGTPGSSACDLMDDLEDLWLAVAPNKTADDFDAEVSTLFQERDAIDLEEMEAAYARINGIDGLEFASWPLIEKPILIAYGHAVLAWLDADSPDPGARDLAWASVRDSSCWHGVALGLARIRNRGLAPTSISKVNRKSAEAGHTENRAIQEDAFKWLDNNFTECRSKDDAAQRLLKIVPVTFRTTRRYVDRWELSRHSTRRV